MDYAKVPCLECDHVEADVDPAVAKRRMKAHLLAAHGLVLTVQAGSAVSSSLGEALNIEGSPA